MTKRVHFFINGMVQGVFLRKSAKIEAEKMGIVGWIRNRKDGSVEVVAQGEEANVKKFIDWCKKGPPLSKVSGIEIDWKHNLEDFDEFSIV